MTVYGYARVSIIGQDLEIQIQQLVKNGANIIYKEEFTGTRTGRPQFKKLVSVLEEGDTLIVTKLDRLASSASQAEKLVEELISKGVKVHILNIGILDNTPTSELIKKILFARLEFECDVIIERTEKGEVIPKQKPDYRRLIPKLKEWEI